MRKILQSAVVAVAATAMVMPAASALAGTATIDDSTKDTFKVSYDQETGKETVKASKQDVNIDLDKVVVRHSAKRLEIVGHYVSMKKKAMDLISLGSSFETDQSEYHMYAVGFRDGDKWDIQGSAFEAGPVMGRRGGTECDVKADVDWAKGEFTISAPRSCFGNPAWVKAHAESSAGEVDGEDFINYFDNAHTDKGNHKGVTGKIKKG